MGLQTNREGTLCAPLLLSRICLEKVWGGRALESVPGITLDCDGPVGETWELVDRDDVTSKVRGGEFDGMSLRGLMQSFPAELLGELEPDPSGRFPLLVKFISASRVLSVQVHPDDLVANKLGAGEPGKTEAWYVLAAEDASRIYLGLREGIDGSELTAAAGGAEVTDLMQEWPVKAGDFVFVPAGTLHAIGEGITLVEVQQNSDVTFRVYDWGRVGLDGKPRETHVDKALLSTKVELELQGPLQPDFEQLEDGSRRALLVESPAFSLELLEITGVHEGLTDNSPVVLVVTRGQGEVGDTEGGEARPTRAGDTWLIPAAARGFRVQSRGGDFELLRVDARK